MPLDPSLSLAVQYPQSSGTAGGLALVGQFANIQNSLNQNRLFQQTFAARQRAGQILAAAPDIETGISQLSQDPLVAPFAGTIISPLREAQMFQAQYQGAMQTQSLEGQKAAAPQVLSGLLSNPTLAGYTAGRSAALVGLNPAVQGRVGSYLDSIATSLTPDPADGPPGSSGYAAAFQRNIAAKAAALGVSTDTIKMFTPQNVQQDVGGGINFGTVAPPMGSPFAPGAPPGGFTSVGGLSKTLPPILTTPTVGPLGTPTPTILGGGPGTYTSAGGSSNVLTSGQAALLNRASPGSIAGAGINLPGLAGPTQEQSAANAKTGEAGGEIADEMIANGRTLPTQLNRLDLMTNALGQFQAGGGADARATLGKALQAIRNAGGSFVTQNMIDQTANQSLSDTQLLQSLARPLAIGQLKEAAQGTGRVMKSEVDSFLEMMDATNDPNTLMALLNNAKYSLQVGYDQSQKYMQFKQALAKGDPAVKGLGPSDFYGWYNQNFSRSNLPVNAGSLSLGPTPASAAKGGGPTVTHRYVPGQGIVPIGQ